VIVGIIAVFAFFSFRMPTWTIFHFLGALDHNIKPRIDILTVVIRRGKFEKFES